jgi:alpha-D-ribose 1-methylphosphonate 5-triphosphate synthase subunit PhnH
MPAFASVPVPDSFETRTNTTFQALMWALSRPGTLHPLPAPGMASIAEALVDRECRVHTDDPDLARTLASFGAALVPVAMADHCFTALPTPEMLAQVAIGSALYPDAGATVITTATYGTGQRLRLTGPGIDTHTDISLSGLAALWPIRAARCRYPAGFDLFLICGTSMIGLPRSTQIEVL